MRDPFRLVHAGLLPQWSTTSADRLAGEVEDRYCRRRLPYRDILRALYPSKHLQWSPDLTGPTRLATVDQGFDKTPSLFTGWPDGILTLAVRRNEIPTGLFPLVSVFPLDIIAIPRSSAAIGPRWGCTARNGFWPSIAAVCGVDKLTAVRLEDRKVFQVDGLPHDCRNS